MSQNKPKKDVCLGRAHRFPHNNPFIVRNMVRELGVPNMIIGKLSIKVRPFRQRA